MTPPVRPARPEDRPAIEAIQSTALVDPTPGLLGVALSGPMVTLVAVDVADVPVGYVLATRTDRRAYVPELAVEPDRQGQGVGSALLSAVCERLAEEGVERVRLTARASDRPVRAFYENRDFEAIGRVDDHYVDGDDGIVYERLLD